VRAGWGGTGRALIHTHTNTHTHTHTQTQTQTQTQTHTHTHTHTLTHSHTQPDPGPKTPSSRVGAPPPTWEEDLLACFESGSTAEAERALRRKYERRGYAAVIRLRGGAGIDESTRMALWSCVMQLLECVGGLVGIRMVHREERRAFFFSTDGCVVFPLPFSPVL
jgi:hypothetical protein